MKQPVFYCQGKVIYDKRGAITAANLRRKESGIDLRAYQCPMDDHWHLTKSQVRKGNYKYGKFYGKQKGY